MSSFFPAITFGLCLLCPTSSQAQNPTLPPALQVLVDVVCDRNAEWQKRDKAYEKIWLSQDAARLDAFAQIVNKADEEYAREAADDLIRLTPQTAAPIVTPQILFWSAQGQLFVLASVADILQIKPDMIALQPIARKVLQQFPFNTPASINPSPAGIAAIILARGPASEDRALIYRQLSSHREDSRLWLAAALLGEVPAALQTHGKVILLDRRRSSTLRLAVATALAATDTQALGYVSQSINQFLRAYGDQDALKVALADLKNSARPGQSAKVGQSLRMSLQSVTLNPLFFLKESTIKSMIFPILKRRNIIVQDLASLALAMRAPEQFLKLRKEDVLPERYYLLLAYIALRHPQLKSQVARKISPAQLNAALKKLQQSDFFGTFPGSGRMALGF